MVEWIDASTLAEISGLTNRSIQRKACCYGWPFREVPCRGGLRREYLISALPPTLRDQVEAYFARQQAQEECRLQEQALASTRAQAQEADRKAARQAALDRARVHAAALAAQEKEEERARLARHEESLAKFHQLLLWQQKYALAKWEVIKACNVFLQENRLPLTRGQELFVNEYNIGRIEVEESVRQIYPQVSLSSLRLWIQQEHQSGLLGLIDGYGHRRDTGRIDQDPHLQDLIRGYMGNTPHIRHTHLLQTIHAGHPEYRDLKISTLDRWLRALMASPEGSYWRFRKNPAEWRRNEEAAFGDADSDIVRLNQRWEMDSTPADVMLEDGRHHVLVVIDVYSRRMKLLVSKTSKAIAAGTLYRRALLAWGVNEVLRIDNGKEFVSNYFERLLHDLAITPHWCTPYNPKEKPFVEAGIKTFCYGLLELRRDYIGHSVAERKALQDREAFMKRMFHCNETINLQTTAADLQAFCDDWAEAVYGRNLHEGLGGLSPFERAAAWREPIRRIADERALDILLAPIPRDGGRRLVGPKGIELDRAHYFCDDLIPYMGRRIFCRWDPDDIGKLYVFGGRDLSTFVGIALCPQRADLGISQKEAAMAAHVRQEAFLQEAHRQVKQAQKALSQADPVQTVLDYRKEQAAKVVELPHASVPHETEALKEASAAVQAARRQLNPPTATVSPETQERFLRAMERYEAQERIEEPRDRYMRLWELPQEARTPEEEAWMRNFEKTPTGRATRFFLEEWEKDRQEAARERERRRASAM